MNNEYTIVPLLMSALLLMACSDGTSGKNGSNTLVKMSTLSIGNEQCAMGGQLLQSGLDVNANGVLDESEIDDAQSQTVCHGQGATLKAELVGRYQSEIYGLSAAEIVDFDPLSKQVFVINAKSGKVDVLNAADIDVTDAVSGSGALALNNIVKTTDIDVAADVGLTHLGGVNSLSVYGDLLAVAIERGDALGNSKQANGFVAFYRINDAGETSFLHAVEVGALPDNVTFNRNGSLLIVANEGEPNTAYSLDPEGSISMIAIKENIPATTATAIGFADFNKGGAREGELDSMIKINGPNASVAQDLEPEYIAVSEDNLKAYVSLQENNAIAVIDLKDKKIESILPLGLKDYGLYENRIDASDKDSRINFSAYAGVYGMYQPDTISSYQWRQTNFIVTANEGDARDYDGFSEEARADDLNLDPSHPQLGAAQDKTQLGRLKVTTSMGDIDNDGDVDQIISYGARSFSIWDEHGNQVFDSGSEFSRITAAVLGDNFNNNNDENKGDSRSDDKAGEPEALAIGKIADQYYAFIGLERTGGIMIYNITNPFSVSFVDYVVNRDFDTDFEIDSDTGEVKGDASLAGDLGPEGMKFISANDSPTSQPLLVIGNEVSGTTSVYALSF
ncbi:alkaline phosphatase [Shewanella sp. Choline-02u-19]|uniref:choice-of-anchor I family protein n=1 Tax=unclassified Shewanella TaxID=196818 RepID=UPI000C34F895|nr:MULTISPECIES: choice-of-anchor I family protein [unclassified Shewanella]PKH56949.1 alkaline phosphatase [Shewanella sp. Bg11-22]PKI27746.1 alkaline phosphatase [Shewanella sp. Choline-02u-19]